MNAHSRMMDIGLPLRQERSASFLDLGHEAPIDLSGVDHPIADRRGVSWRWLSAATLVGAFGAALIASAIYIAMDGATSFSEAPEMKEEAAAPEPTGERSGRKGNKLVETRAVASAKQIIRAPMTQRVGEREISRVRPFIRLSAPLSLTTGAYATDVPPFNPLKLFSDSSPDTERFADTATEPADADVTVVKRDLASLAIPAGPSRLTDADILAQIAEDRAVNASRARQPALPYSAQLMLGRTLTQPDKPADGPLSYSPSVETRFSNLEVRVVPENVTVLAKDPPATASKPVIEQKTLVVKKGESLAQLLKDNGATPDQQRSILTAFGAKAKTGAAAEGQVMEVLIAPGLGAEEPRQIVRAALLVEGRVDAIAAITDRGQFVSVAPPREEEAEKPSAAADEEEEEENTATGPRLYDSLYETGTRYEMPRALIGDMVRIFASDVDFQRRISGGDNLEVIYTDSDEGEGSRNEILSATLSVGGETHRIYRFQSPEDGAIDYFDEQGRSLKKFLLRKPISDGELRSGFGMRYHPILGYSKMHTGVDYANSIGTPIVAAGNGVVLKAGWSSGYGKHTEIQHANGYVTTYSHQSAFARGIQEGARVRQGQVIGYLGSTGLSTGPHLHYEVKVNGNFVNPLRIKVPRGRELSGPSLAEFKRQRDEIDGLITKAGGAKLAQAR